MRTDFSQTAVLLENVGVEYRVPRERIPTLKEFAIQRLLRGQIAHHKFWALQDLNLEIRRGEVLGIVGANGAGKSTLLKVIAQIIKPTTGRVRVWGHVTSLLELSAGLDPDLTGRENIYLNCALLGYTRVQIAARLDGMIDFAGVREFIDAPLRTYSTGMAVRLAFAMATEQVAEILLLDEVLSVGDKDFAAASLARILSMVKQGTTVLFISHELPLVQNLCTQTVWLEHGAIKMAGQTAEVLQHYQQS